MKLGSSPTTYKIMEAAIPELEKMGYKVETKVFDDYVLPNTAVMEGSMDGNIFQHQAYLDEFNKNNKTNLVMVDKLVLSPHGLYSETIEDVAGIPDNAMIGIFQDASNQDRALRLLQKNKLIKLNEKKEGMYSLLDIDENPKNLEFKTMDINQLIKNIDQLDAAFIPTSQLGLLDTEPKYRTAVEEVEEISEETLKYAIGFVVKSGNEDAQWAQDVVEAFKKNGTQEEIKKAFKGRYNMVVGKGK